MRTDLNFRSIRINKNASFATWTTGILIFDKKYEAKRCSDVVETHLEPTFSIFDSFEVGATLRYQEIAGWMNKTKK